VQALRTEDSGRNDELQSETCLALWAGTNAGAGETPSEGAWGSPLWTRRKQTKQITQLQHKLNQAFENVRQAESTRRRGNLKETLSMNESLQRAKVG
jgi:hypothetical protein